MIQAVDFTCYSFPRVKDCYLCKDEAGTISRAVLHDRTEHSYRERREVEETPIDDRSGDIGESISDDKGAAERGRVTLGIGAAGYPLKAGHSMISAT